MASDDVPDRVAAQLAALFELQQQLRAVMREIREHAQKLVMLDDDAAALDHEAALLEKLGALFEQLAAGSRENARLARDRAAHLRADGLIALARERGVGVDELVRRAVEELEELGDDPDSNLGGGDHG